VARTCNLIFIVLDVLKPLGDKKIIESELEGFGIRLNKQPPNITVRKKEKGGIAITNTVPLTNIDHDEIKAILSECACARPGLRYRALRLMTVQTRCRTAMSRSGSPAATSRISSMSLRATACTYQRSTFSTR
jgi:hypothetical protein